MRNYKQIDCDDCEDKMCRACDKPFMERHSETEEDFRFFEHVVCLFIALGIVCAIWAVVWYAAT